MTFKPRYSDDEQLHALFQDELPKHALYAFVGFVNGIPKDPVGRGGRLGGIDARGVASTSVAVMVSNTVDALYTESVPSSP